MRRHHLPLSKLIESYRPYPQILTSHKVHERKDLQAVPSIQTKIRQFEENLGSKGRILIRYSGTEPVVRIMIEGPDHAVIKKMAEELGSCIETSLAL